MYTIFANYTSLKSGENKKYNEHQKGKKKKGKETHDKIFSLFQLLQFLISFSKLPLDIPIMQLVL